MQHLKLFSAIIVSAFLLSACSGNTTANTNKDSVSQTSSSLSGSGDDMYYELTTTSTGKNLTMNGITKMYVSSKGDMRVEMNFTNSMSPDKKADPIIIIGHSDKPDESISIDDSAKTYSINHISADELNSGEKTQSTATKIGEEKILGFNCVHARIISTKKIGNFYSETDTIDLWRSNDVPMQANVKDLFDKFQSRTGNFMYTPETEAQLKAMGCEGFMTKMEMKNKNVSMTMQLTKSEHRNLSADMFQIPEGYTEDKNGL
ncbi:MAG: DUF4412 domain-containing protein [Parafilimonas sp.]